jgi:ribosomal protein L11 methyltransferase
MANGNDYIGVSINTGSNADKKDILIAQLSGIGFEGFEEEKNLLKAFVPEKNFDDLLLQPIIEQSGMEYKISVIKYKNWNEVWEAGFDPVIVGNFCAIRATFHQPVGGVEYEIIITPKMSFGTGHHATTYLMIEAMRNISIKGKSVFDFGTGTGVLAILAERMGASIIEAIDIDDWSIENGKENLLENQSEKILLYKSEEITSLKKFDVILANINRNIILQHLGAMQAHLSPGGVIVLSGLLTGDEEAVSIKAADCHLKLSLREERQSWICFQFVNVQD